MADRLDTPSSLIVRDTEDSICAMRYGHELGERTGVYTFGSTLKTNDYVVEAKRYNPTRLGSFLNTRVFNVCMLSGRKGVNALLGL